MGRKKKTYEDEKIDPIDESESFDAVSEFEQQKPETVKTALPLRDGGPSLMFVTTAVETLALCPEIGYDKRVAWNDSRTGGTLQEIHDGQKKLFEQYVKDAQQFLN